MNLWRNHLTSVDVSRVYLLVVAIGYRKFWYLPAPRAGSTCRLALVAVRHLPVTLSPIPPEPAGRSAEKRPRSAAGNVTVLWERRHQDWLAPSQTEGHLGSAREELCCGQETTAAAALVLVEHGGTGSKILRYTGWFKKYVTPSFQVK